MWSLPALNESPDSIPLKENDVRVALIRFNDRYIDSLRGFAFKRYRSEGLTAPMKIFGVMVFMADSTPLDDLQAGSSSLLIDYDPHPELAQVMEGCSILDTQDLRTANTSIRIYDFRCKLMYGARS